MHSANVEVQHCNYFSVVMLLNIFIMNYIAISFFLLLNRALYLACATSKLASARACESEEKQPKRAQRNRFHMRIKGENVFSSTWGNYSLNVLHFSIFLKRIRRCTETFYRSELESKVHAQRFELLTILQAQFRLTTSF